MMCGSCSIENSFKLMYFKHMDKVRGGRDFNQEEMESCMINQVSFSCHHLQNTIYVGY